MTSCSIALSEHAARLRSVSVGRGGLIDDLLLRRHFAAPDFAHEQDAYTAAASPVISGWESELSLSRLSDS